MVRSVIKVLSLIYSSDYPYKKYELLLSYLWLLCKSVAYHKGLLKVEKVKRINLLGLGIMFFHYGQLINLFEEIFVSQVYKTRISKSAPVIVDCGSNIGLSVLYFKKLFPNARILAFEPSLETFEILCQNIKLNHIRDVMLYNLAVTDKSGKSLLSKHLNIPGFLGMSLKHSMTEQEHELVSCDKLSNYIDQYVDLVKIDVEGSELEIVGDLLQTKKIIFCTQMIIEYHQEIIGHPVSKFISLLNTNNFYCTVKKAGFNLQSTGQIIYCLSVDKQLK